MPSLPSNARDSSRLDPATFVGTPGFFRVGQDAAGRHHLIDPSNQSFLYRGVTSINRSGRAGGRRARPGPYTDTCLAKYGSTSQPWVQSVIERLRSWGFNAFGAWAEDSLFEQGFPYTEILDFAHNVPLIEGQGVRLPDVFDPHWEYLIDLRCAGLCAPRKNSTDLIGYFTENEMAWAAPGEEEAWGGITLTQRSGQKIYLLQHCLSQTPDRPSHQVAWGFLQKRHGDLAAIAKAWGLNPTTDLADRTDIAKRTKEGHGIFTTGYGADCEAFCTYFAEAFFQKSAAAIRRYDPNHLQLGCRFGGPPGKSVLAACKRDVLDVLSANNYQERFADRVEIYAKPTGLPVLNGEFAWSSGHFSNRAVDEPESHPLLQRMHERGTAALENAFVHPSLVGYTWYRWVDQPSHTPPTNYGLVGVNDQTQLHHTELLTRINARLEGIAGGTIEPAAYPVHGPLIV